MSHRRRHRLKIRSLYVWHRYVGLTVAILVILLAGTGVALNHTERWALDTRFVHSHWLLDWYGIEAPESAVASIAGRHRIILLGTKLYVDTQPLNDEFRTLNGAVARSDLLIVAVDNDLLLLSGQGEYLERLSEGDGAPGAIEDIGTDSEGRIVAHTTTGYFRADAQLLDWEPLDGAVGSVIWSATTSLSGPDIVAVQDDYLAHILPWERVILDLHSGRLFGNFGIWLMDGAAVLMLFLAGSGVFMWWRRQR